MAHPIPAGHHTITPHLIDQGRIRGDRVLQAGLRGGGALPHAIPGPDGQVKLGHAELQIGDSRLFLADEFPEQGGFGPGGHLAGDDPPVRDRRQCRVRPCRRGGREGGHAPGRHVLGRPLRQADRPVRAPLVDRRAPGRPDARADAGADGGRHGRAAVRRTLSRIHAETDAAFGAAAVLASHALEESRASGGRERGAYVNKLGRGRRRSPHRDSGALQGVRTDL